MVLINPIPHALWTNNKIVLIYNKKQIKLTNDNSIYAMSYNVRGSVHIPLTSCPCFRCQDLSKHQLSLFLRIPKSTPPA